jgi:uncharacterized protein YecT (DUF1311 family)
MSSTHLRSLVLALLLFGCGAGSAGNSADPCADSSEPEREACYVTLAASADEALERFFGLAMEHAAAPAELQAAQVAWEGYVDLHCHAIYENHVEARIRSSLFTMCRWELARARTVELWRAYLEPADIEQPEYLQ